MKVNREGLELIKRFEGLRTTAYRDPAGVWTIGYGHTSMAGEPEARQGLTITRGEASRILERDVEQFAAGVKRLLVRPLNDSQFSALVSFAYNVGLENFTKSSVLKAVNAGDFAAVGRRLQLWVKAGGNVMPGLIRRRAAEAALFSNDEGSDDQLPRFAQSLKGKSLFGSTTNLAALLAALSGTVTALSASFKDVAGITGGEPTAMALMGLMLAAAAWIIWERRRKSQDDGV